jgi:outer membrane protein
MRIDVQDRNSRSHFPFFLFAMALLAALGLAACATMTDLSKRTAPSSSEPWVPPAAAERPPAPGPAPAIPAELQAPERVWTLGDIVGVGLANNLQTRAAWDAARAAAATSTMALGEYLPVIDAAVTGTKQKAVFAGGQFIIDQTTMTPQANLSLLLFDFGGREADVRAARMALEAANWTQNAVFQDVIFRIESAYYQFLSARALLQAQAASRESAKTNYEAANVRHEAGVATVADVLQAKTALSTIDLQIVTTKGLIQNLHGQLANAMGLPAQSAFEVAAGLPEEVPFASAAPDVERAIREAEAARPDLAAARAGVLEAEARVRKARSTFYPSFSLSGDIGRIYYQGKTTSNPFYAFSLKVDLSFLFGFQQYAVLQAKAQAELARDQMTDLGRAVGLQVWTSYENLKTAEQEVLTAREVLASAQASHDVALGRYKEGVGSILDLLSAEAALADGRVQLVRAKSDWFLALVQFTHDTGTLTPPAGPGKGDRRP